MRYKVEGKFTSKDLIDVFIFQCIVCVYLNISKIFKKNSICFITQFFQLIFKGPSDLSITFPKKLYISCKSSSVPLVRLGCISTLILTFALSSDEFEGTLVNSLTGLLRFVLILEVLLAFDFCLLISWKFLLLWMVEV